MRGKWAVNPELRQEWLRRYEVGGELPTQIAKDGWDPRTVRKGIQQAREEREAQLIRREVLGRALSEHYHELVEQTQKLDDTFSSKTPKQVSSDWLSHPLSKALEEHLPKSPLWKSLKVWNESIEKYEKFYEDYSEFIIVLFTAKLEELKGKRMGKELGWVKDSMEETIAVASRKAIEPRPVAIRYHQSKEFLLQAADLLRKQMAKSEISVPYKGAEEGIVLLNKIFVVEPVWDKWDEFQEIQHKLEDLSMAIRTELSTIIWRKVVPGRCRFCPV